MNPEDRLESSHDCDAKHAGMHSGACCQLADSPLQAALDFLLRSTEAVRKSGCTRRGTFHIEVDALREWGQAKRLILAAHTLDQFTPVASGAKHEVFFDPVGQKAIKLTRPGAFGHSVAGVGLSATPCEYLLRWLHHNVLFGDTAEMIGILCGEASVQCVISQKWVTANDSEPTPTEAEIESFFRQLNFEKIAEIDVPVFYSRLMDLVILDAHPHNILRDEAGNLVPIDLVVGTPLPWTRDWLCLNDKSTCTPAPQ